MGDLLHMFLIFFRIGAFTFGGGVAMLPIIQRDMVHEGWMTSDEVMDYIAIAQASPGVIAVNIATLVGYKVKGWAGSIMAALGVILPSLIIITLIGLFLSTFQSIEWIQKALKGINIAVVILLLDAVISLGSKTIKDYKRVLISVSTFVVVWFFGVSVTMAIAFWILLGTLVFGYSQWKSHRGEPHA